MFLDVIDSSAAIFTIFVLNKGIKVLSKGFLNLHCCLIVNRIIPITFYDLILLIILVTMLPESKAIL